ncbi:hypothetical protein Kpol_344p6 [Vanderwaltozyma polyspora DSM 70294]|uniref:PH domain-containing protein n=1 Tax=Vanderwaltozyma polyspora (strain ATCC 22028 / DSM 70294 / BCRC 21397 / CBS 2163 / NBRC 10782 / NRRL Y-8283 / UCD 57-17) TaxID=436907 RepID=A7TSS2_VANPO|nr:uncharacterized protein Kpol_344p6 [Vanderwaltozyma polyspora DSM 70294]EDO14686.1 hypothetical protein Kpol_344p6 [Vanderwaltozyma polyspora DSM 70294]
MTKSKKTNFAAAALDDINEKVNDQFQNIVDNEKKIHGINQSTAETRNTSNTTNNNNFKNRHFSFSTILSKRDRTSTGSMFADNVNNGNDNMNFVMDLSDNLLIECRRLQGEIERKSKKLNQYESKYNKLIDENKSLTENYQNEFTNLNKLISDLKEQNTQLNEKIIQQNDTLNKSDQRNKDLVFNSNSDMESTYGSETKMNIEEMIIAIEKQGNKIIPLKEYNGNLENIREWEFPSENYLIEKSQKFDKVLISKDELHNLNNPTLNFLQSTLSKLGYKAVKEDEVQKDNRVPEIEYSIDDIIENDAFDNSSVAKMAKKLNLTVLSNDDFNDLQNLIQHPTTEYLNKKVMETDNIMIDKNEYDLLMNNLKNPDLDEISILARENGYILVNANDINKFENSSDENITDGINNGEYILLRTTEYETLAQQSNTNINKEEVINLCSKFDLIPLSQRKYDELIKGPDEETMSKFASEFGYVALPREEFDILQSKIESPTEDVIEKYTDERGLMVIKKVEYEALNSKINNISKLDLENMAEKLSMKVLTNDAYDSMVNEINNRSARSTTPPASRVLASKQFFEQVIREENDHQDKILHSTKKMGFVTLSNKEYTQLKENQKDHILTKTDIYNGAKNFELTVLPTDEYKQLLKRKNFRNSLTYDDIKQFAAKFDMKLTPIGLSEYDSPRGKVKNSSLMFRGLNESNLSILSTETQSIYYDAAANIDKSRPSSSVLLSESRPESPFIRKSTPLKKNIDIATDKSSITEENTGTEDGDDASINTMSDSVTDNAESERHDFSLLELKNKALEFGYRLIPLDVEVNSEETKSGSSVNIVNESIVSNPSQSSGRLVFSDGSRDQNIDSFNFETENSNVSTQPPSTNNYVDNNELSKEYLEEKANDLGLMLITETEFMDLNRDKVPIYTEESIREEAKLLNLAVLEINELNSLHIKADYDNISTPELRDIVEKRGYQLLSEQEVENIKEEFKESLLSPTNIQENISQLGYSIVPTERYTIEMSERSNLDKECIKLKEQNEELQLKVEELTMPETRAVEKESKEGNNEENKQLELQNSIDRLIIENENLSSDINNIEDTHNALKDDHIVLVSNHEELKLQLETLTVHKEDLERRIDELEDMKIAESELNLPFLKQRAIELGMVIISKEEHDDFVGQSFLENTGKFDYPDDFVRTHSRNKSSASNRLSSAITDSEGRHSDESLTSDLLSKNLNNIKEEENFGSQVQFDEGISENKAPVLTEEGVRNLATDFNLIVLTRDEYTKLTLAVENPNNGLEFASLDSVNSELSKLTKYTEKITVQEESHGSRSSSKQGIVDSSSLEDSLDELLKYKTPQSTVGKSADFESNTVANIERKLSFDEITHEAEEMGFMLVNKDEHKELLKRIEEKTPAESDLDLNGIKDKASKYNCVVLESDEFKAIKQKIDNSEISAENIINEAPKYDLVVLPSNDYEELNNKLKNPVLTEKQLREQVAAFDSILLPQIEYGQLQEKLKNPDLSKKQLEEYASQHNFIIVDADEYNSTKGNGENRNLTKEELISEAENFDLVTISKDEFNLMRNEFEYPTLNRQQLTERAIEFDSVIVDAKEYKQMEKAIQNPIITKEQIADQAPNFNLILLEEEEYEKLLDKEPVEKYANQSRNVSEPINDIGNVRASAKNFGLLCVPENAYISTPNAPTPNPDEDVVLPSSYYQQLLSTNDVSLSGVTNSDLEQEVRKRGLTISSNEANINSFLPPPPIGPASEYPRSHTRSSSKNGNHSEYSSYHGRTPSNTDASVLSRIESGTVNHAYMSQTMNDVVSLPTIASFSEPSMIPALTQTVIGEYLFKYYRRLGKFGGESRHERYFWIHPYTLTLYWSSSNPVLDNPSANKTKGVAILGVESVADNNPYPVGLYHKSIVVKTESRNVKFTCSTRQRHNIWFNSLRYLLQRNMEGIKVNELVDDLSDNMYSGKIFPLPGETSKTANSRLSGSRRVIPSSSSNLGHRSRLPANSSPLLKTNSGLFKRSHH